MGDDENGRAVMVMDSYRVWRRAESDEAKLRMVSENGQNTVRACIHDIFFDVTKSSRV